MKIFRSRNEIN